MNQTLSPIGLDFESRRVGAVQLRRRTGGWEISAAAEFERAPRGAGPDPGEMIRIAGVLERSGFSGDRIVAAVPHEMLVTTSLEAPVQPGTDAARAMARIELSRSLGCPPDAMEMALWTLPLPLRNRVGGGGAAPMLVSAVCHRDSQRFLDGVESAGLQATALEPRVCALFRACAPLLTDPAAVVTIVDLAADAAVTTIVHRGVIVYGRSSESGGLAALEAALVEGLDLDEVVAEHTLWRLGHAPCDAPGDPPRRGGGDWSETEPVVREHFAAVARDAAAAIAYAGHRYPEAPVGGVIACGPGAEMAARESLETVLGQEVVVARPSELVKCHPELSPLCRSPGLTAALGLAMHGEE